MGARLGSCGSSRAGLAAGCGRAARVGAAGVAGEPPLPRRLAVLPAWARRHRARSKDQDRVAR